MRKTTTRIVMALAMLIIPVALAFQAGQDPPDDPNGEFPGQKMWCSNARNIPHKCQCALATDCESHRQKNPDLLGDGMGTKCQTYCVRSRCMCLSPCTS